MPEKRIQKSSFKNTNELKEASQKQMSKKGIQFKNWIRTSTTWMSN
jgi:hypothetical protein